MQTKRGLGTGTNNKILPRVIFTYKSWFEQFENSQEKIEFYWK